MGWACSREPGEGPRLSAAEVAERLPALDVAVLLLFMAELHPPAELPIAVACAEAMAVSKAYGGDEFQRHINGVLASYHREQLPRGGLA